MSFARLLLQWPVRSSRHPVEGRKNVPTCKADAEIKRGELATAEEIRSMLAKRS